MFKKAHLLQSGPMGRKMYLWQYGDFGAPLLVFPSAAGMAHEWEAHGMIDHLGDLVRRGRTKFYCIETNVSEAWTRRESDPAWRIRRHQDFERFVVSELVPFIRADCRTPDIPIATTGCSLGGFYAVNFALKHPEIFRWAFSMSARFDLSQFNPLQNEDVYFNNPLAYVPNLHGDALERVRKHASFTLVCGRGKWEHGNWQETERLGQLLREKGVRSDCHLWGEEVHHEWDWWKKQATLYLNQKFGA